MNTKKRSRLRRFTTVLLILVPPLLAIAGLWTWVEYRAIDAVLVEKFAGRRWDFPSKVYTDTYTVYPGLVLGEGFERRLHSLGYLRVQAVPTRRGQYRVSEVPSRIDLYLTAFEYPARRENGRLIEIALDANSAVASLREMPTGKRLSTFVLEPTLLAGLHGELREDRHEMKIDEVPLPLVRSVLAVEDRRFFEHPGVDARGLARAFFVNLFAGRVRQGGSTLTQQLMKNFFLTEERTISRKLREAAMAIVAERRFTKLEILEAYMNEIYLGQRGSVGIHGMWEASRFYFGREPAELTLGQLATLAGMIRAPNYYSPHEHPERARERRDVVLSLLSEQGEIDIDAYRAAAVEPIDTVPAVTATQNGLHFVDFVREELKENYPADVLTTEGFTILTSLDPELQAFAVEAVADGLRRIEETPGRPEAPSDARLEAALIATNPRTGAILAMVGGRDYKQSQFNRAVQGRRQPGSVFKPVVMLAALGSERVGRVHFLPTTIVPDAPFVWEYEKGMKTWRPENYGDEYNGGVAIRDALQFSVNTVTARIARDVGIEAVRDLAMRLGVEPGIPALPSISLGSWEVSPFEMAQVYGVFANSGFLAKPLAVRSVVDRSGSAVEGNAIKIERRIPATDAYLITQLLEGAVERGTGRSVRRYGFTAPAAGKTGSTNELHDAWFVGYTPDLLCVVWVGYDRDVRLGLTGSRAALPIWTQFMKDAIEGRPQPGFRPPPGVLVENVDPVTGLLASSDCGPGVPTAFLEGEEPQHYCHRRDLEVRRNANGGRIDDRGRDGDQDLGRAPRTGAGRVDPGSRDRYDESNVYLFE